MALRNKPVIISPQAQKDILATLEYLHKNWSQKIVETFIQKLDSFYLIVSANPDYSLTTTKEKNIRNYVLSKHNVIFYRNTKTAIEIITVFDGRQDT